MKIYVKIYILIQWVNIILFNYFLENEYCDLNNLLDDDNFNLNFNNTNFDDLNLNNEYFDKYKAPNIYMV
jgi:predicted nucleic-acid-binding protein